MKLAVYHEYYKKIMYFSLNSATLTNMVYIYQNIHMAVVPISYFLVLLFRYRATIQSIIIIRWRDCLIHTHKHNENKCMIVYRIEMFSMSFSFCRRLRRRHSCQILKGQTLRTFSFCLYFKHELEILQTFHAMLSAYITKYS